VGSVYSGRVLVALILANVDGIKMVNITGQTPVHLHIRDNSFNDKLSLDVLKALVDKCPDVLGVKGRSEIPFFWAVRYSRVEVVRVLLGLRHESFKATNVILQLTIHVALTIETVSLDIVRDLVSAWPESLKQTDCYGDLPPAVAIKNKEIPLPVIEFLLRSWPESVKSQSYTGKPPLHLAVKAKSLSIATVLLAAWPDCILATDYDDVSALSLACQGAYRSTGMLELLANAWPEYLVVTNEMGELPLNCILAWRQVTMTQALTEIWPAGFNQCGHFPLHKMLETHVSHYRNSDLVPIDFEIASFLVDQDPACVDIANGNGNIPLILACSNENVSLDVVILLLRSSVNLILSARRDDH